MHIPLRVCSFTIALVFTVYLNLENIENEYFTRRNQQLQSEYLLNKDKRNLYRSCGVQTEMSEVSPPSPIHFISEIS
jgi:hypothetical protein